MADAEALIAGAFWIGLVATALLVAFLWRRISVATNVLVALGSIFLAVQLVRIYSGPTDAVTIGVPSPRSGTSLQAAGARS